jgi:drug/metabolite transporter (DMT)-like permease
MTQQKASQALQDRKWSWIAAALAAHTAWGIYPVLARYLQTISLLPSMSLLIVGTIGALLGLLLLTRPRVEIGFFRSRLAWAFMVVLAVRIISNLLAARFILAIYVQLITLMTPFLVVLLSARLLRERIPPYTGRAIVIATIGAVLLMSGGLGKSESGFSLETNDWLGIGLALTSSLALALYMILIRRSTRFDVSGEGMLLIQLLTILVISTPISLILGEDWGRWRQLGTADWIAFGVFTIVVLLGANLGQISALRHLGAPLVSSLLAWRLVSALFFAAILLGEKLDTIWQLLGAIIVLSTISWYLWQQREPRRK